jgi:hypothetical protein
MAETSYVIWSHDHCAWWRPKRAGYTQELDRAGRYPEREARLLTAVPHPRSSSRRGMDRPSDTMFPAPAKRLPTEPEVAASVEGDA